MKSRVKERREQKRKRKRRWKWIIGCLLVVVVLIGGFLLFSAWNVYHTVSTIYQPVDRLPSTARPASSTPPKSDSTPANSSTPPATAVPAAPIAPNQTLLILGIDRRPQIADIGRTDVIMLAVLNTHTGKITLASIPRDTYAEIAGQNYKDKINAAFGYGVPTTIASVENFTGLPVDHYVLFDFEGFRKAIDAIGGVTLTIDDNVSSTVQMTPGEHHLNGEQALDFARFRSDNRGDFGRNDRQQQVFKAFLDQTKGVRSPAKIKEMLDVVGADVRTDLNISDMTALATQFGSATSQQVEQIKYNATTATFGPQQLSYVLIDDQERARVTGILHEREQEK